MSGVTQQGHRLKELIMVLTLRNVQSKEMYASGPASKTITFAAFRFCTFCVAARVYLDSMKTAPCFLDKLSATVHSW